MSSSVNDDEDQRNNAGLEDLTTMTIESLRARLLSERSISKSSRQRADELAKRVVELEEQLKLVSLQRKKAEKATADVLTILESNGISDASEAFDSSSDQETVLSDSKVSNDTVKRKESSSGFEVRRSDKEADSSSEIDSSPSTGRSLSWKSSKDSLHSLERKKYVETARRRGSAFTSNSSSMPKRVGKSCRRTRRRETRSVAEELQNDANMPDFQCNRVDTCSQDSPNFVDSKYPANHGVKDLQEAPVSGLSGNSVADAYFSSRNGQVEDMKRALQDQALLIGQYEAEDKAQREWEEKVRENSSYVLDSCDPGNRSDVTEERDEMKASGQLCPATTINSLNRETELQVSETSFHEELKLKVSNNMLVPPHFETGYLLDQRTNSMIARGSPSSDFAFPTSKGTHSQMSSGNLDNTPSESSQISLVSKGSPGTSAHVPFVSGKDGESSGSKHELALMPHKSSSNLESVLKALQQAKFSLNQKLHSMPLLEVGSSGKGIEPSVPGNRNGDGMDIPVGCPGLFRLPTDYLIEATAKVNYLGSNSTLSLTNGYPEPAPDKLLGCPYVEPRSTAFLGDQYYTSSSSPFNIRSSVHRPAPPFPQGGSGIHTTAIMPFTPTPFTQGASGIHTSAMPFTDIRPNIPASRPVLEPALDSGLSSSGRSTYLDPQLNAGFLLPSRYTYPAYPFYPEVTPRVPANERFSRNAPSMEFGMPSSSGFSFYDDHIRPNMYK